MSSKEKKGKNSKSSKATEKRPEPAKDSPPPAEEKKDALNEEEDVDLSSLEIASTITDEDFTLDGPKLILSDNINESYKDILSTCSSTAHDIKQSIHDVLNSRERVVITEVDPTAELQESLSKKIADFAQVVGSSFAPQELSSEIITEKETEDKSPEAQTPESSPLAEVVTQQTGIVAEVKPQKPSEEVEVKPQQSSTVVEGKSQQPSIEVEVKPQQPSIEADVKPQQSSIEADVKPQQPSTMADVNVKPVQPNIVKKDSDVEAKTELEDKAESQIQVLDSLKEGSKTAPPFDEDKLSKKQKNGASKKKGDKSLDQILKSLGNGNAEEKLRVIGKKYMEALEELKVNEPKLKQLERQVVTQLRDKELVQAENNRLILAKSRLEGLCRELQKQNKIIREESAIRLKLEEEKRKEIATKFQVTLTDISGLMQENSKNNTQLRAENAELATKLKSLVDNYEVWEQNVTKVVHQKELEAQLANAKHAKVNLLLKQESEKFLREKQSLLENLSELQKRCTMLASNELQLRTELADYTSKYEEFQSVLTNSSKVFATFKTDMDATSKKIKKLEKETNLYKQKWESSNKALVDMISHKKEQDKDFSNAQQRIALLEKLCRALQAERNDLQNQLNTLTPNSESSTTTEVPNVTTTESSV